MRISAGMTWLAQDRRTLGRADDKLALFRELRRNFYVSLALRLRETA